jgi:hypothetical protein
MSYPINDYSLRAAAQKVLSIKGNTAAAAEDITESWEDLEFYLNPIITISATTEAVVGDTGATVTVVIDKAHFVAAAETEANWTIDAGETGLTLATAVKVDDATVTLTFTGTVAAGELSIIAKAETYDFDKIVPAAAVITIEAAE